MDLAGFLGAGYYSLMSSLSALMKRSLPLPSVSTFARSHSTFMRKRHTVELFSTVPVSTTRGGIPSWRTSLRLRYEQSVRYSCWLETTPREDFVHSSTHSQSINQVILPYLQSR